MTTEITKKTTTSTTITWSGKLSDDDGTRFASLSGSLDSTKPLGTSQLLVTNRTLYSENEEAAKEAFAAFQTLVNSAADETSAAAVVTEDVTLS